MTHQEKDFGDYLEEYIIKIDGALLKINEEVLLCNQEIAKLLVEIGDLGITRLDNNLTLSLHKLKLTQEASRMNGKIQGLHQAKNILLGKK
jgi:hypothetical protein